MGDAMDCKFHAKGVQKHSTKKTYKFRVKFDAKSTKTRPGAFPSTQKHRRSNRTQLMFIDLLALPGLPPTMIWTIFGSKNMFFCDPKNDQKTGPSKITFFRGFLRFLGLRAHDFHRFWVPKVISGAHFSGGFPVIGFMHVFWYAFVKKHAFHKF